MSISEKPKVKGKNRAYVLKGGWSVKGSRRLSRSIFYLSLEVDWPGLFPRGSLENRFSPCRPLSLVSASERARNFPYLVYLYVRVCLLAVCLFVCFFFFCCCLKILAHTASAFYLFTARYVYIYIYVYTATQQIIPILLLLSFVKINTDETAVMATLPMQRTRLLAGVPQVSNPVTPGHHALRFFG